MMAREGVVDANDMLKSRAFRDKQEAAVKAEREMIEAHRPKDLQDQVDGWAKKELDL
jgi:3-keto-L-gulonate-6-phosphate decarboxylase